jgi:UDP-N-acetyl-D-galactosamine dehydrogenase
VVTDPWASAVEVQHEYGIKLEVISDQNPVDSLIVAVGHKEFRQMRPESLIKLCNTTHQPVLGDLKSLFDRHSCAEAGFKVFRF